MDGNGQSDNESRIGRVDLVRERVIRDHEEFSVYYQRLLAAGAIRRETSLAHLREKVREIGENLNRLIAWSEETRHENEVRFRRLEEKH